MEDIQSTVAKLTRRRNRARYQDVVNCRGLLSIYFMFYLAFWNDLLFTLEQGINCVANRFIHRLLIVITRGSRALEMASIKARLSSSPCAPLRPPMSA